MDPTIRFDFNKLKTKLEQVLKPNTAATVAEEVTGLFYGKYQPMLSQTHLRGSYPGSGANLGMYAAREPYQPYPPPYGPQYQRYSEYPNPRSFYEPFYPGQAPFMTPLPVTSTADKA